MDAAAEHTKACLWSWDPGALQSAVRFLDGELSKAGFDARRVWDLSTAAAVANGKLAVVHVAKPQSVQRFATRALNIFHYWERIDVRATYSSPALLMSRAQALYASNVSSVSSDDMAPCLGALQTTFARADMLDVDIYVEYCRGLLRFGRACDCVPGNGMVKTALGQASSLLFCLLGHYSVQLPAPLPLWCEAQDVSSKWMAGARSGVALSFAEAMQASHRLSSTAAPASLALQRCALLAHVPSGSKHTLLSHILLAMTGHVLWAVVSRGVTLHDIRSEGLRLYRHLASSATAASLPAQLPPSTLTHVGASEELEALWKLCLACFGAAMDIAPEPAQQAEMALVLHDATVEYLTAVATCDRRGRGLPARAPGAATGTEPKTGEGADCADEEYDGHDAGPGCANVSSISTLTASLGGTGERDALDMSLASSSALSMVDSSTVHGARLLHASCSAPPSPVLAEGRVCVRLVEDSVTGVGEGGQTQGGGMGLGDLLASMLVPPPCVLASNASEEQNGLALSLAQANVARLRQAAAALGLQEVNGSLQGEGAPTPVPGQEAVGSPLGEGVASVHLVAFSPVGSGLLMYEGGASAVGGGMGDGSLSSASPPPTVGLRALATKKRRRNQRSTSMGDESSASVTDGAFPVSSAPGGGGAGGQQAVHASPKVVRRLEEQGQGDTCRLSPAHPAPVRGTAEDCSQLAARSSPARPCSVRPLPVPASLSTTGVHGPGSPERRTAFKAHTGVGLSPERARPAQATDAAGTSKYPTTPARPRQAPRRGVGAPSIDSEEEEDAGNSEQVVGDSGPSSSQQEELVQYTSGLTIQSPPARGPTQAAGRAAQGGLQGSTGTRGGETCDSDSDTDVPLLRSVASWASSSAAVHSPTLSSLLGTGRVHWTAEVLATELNRRAARQASMDESMMAQATDYSSIFSRPPPGLAAAGWPASPGSAVETSAASGSSSPGSLPAASPRDSMQRGSSLASPYGSLAMAPSPIPPAAAPPDQNRAERLPGAWPVTIPSQRCWPMIPPKYSPLSPAYGHRLWWIYSGGLQEAVKPLCPHGLLVDEEWDLLAVALKRAHAAAVTELRLQKALAVRAL